MDDSKWGSEDRRGYWKPNKPLTYPNVFVWPLSLSGIRTWLPQYLFPWTIVYAGLSVVVFLCLTPSVARMQTLSMDWVFLILLRNYALHIVVVGLLHLWLYTRQSQGTAFKYNRRWPQPRNPIFTASNAHIWKAASCSGMRARTNFTTNQRIRFAAFVIYTAPFSRKYSSISGR